MYVRIEQVISELERYKDIMRELLQDIAVLSADEFDKNFERQGFFGESWTKRKGPSKYVLNRRNDKGRSILIKTGALRRSINYKIEGSRIVFYSRLPYARVHNEGGEIFHPGGTAYYYDRKRRKIVFVSELKAYERRYKRTLPHRIRMPQRRFIGSHPKLIEEIKKYIEGELGI